MTPEAGDLIFFYTDGSWWDVFIKKVSPKYTHCAFAVSATHCIEANGRGVTINVINRKAKHDIVPLTLPALKKREAMHAAIQHLSQPYSYLDALRLGAVKLLGFSWIWPQPNRWTCSEFVGMILFTKLLTNLNLAVKFADLTPDDVYSYVPKAPVSDL